MPENRLLSYVSCSRCGEDLEVTYDCEAMGIATLKMIATPCPCTVNAAVNAINEKMESLEQQHDESALPEASQKADKSLLLHLASGMRAAREIIINHAGIS